MESKGWENMKWTKEQTQAIFEKNHNILVAAAARKSEKQRCWWKELFRRF